MLGCSTCGKWEHLSCRGYFEVPTGSHMCHQCKKTLFTSELQVWLMDLTTDLWYEICTLCLESLSQPKGI